MRYSDNVTCEHCQKPMRGKGLEKDPVGDEFIACEYCGTKYAVVRQQLRPGGRIKLLTGSRLPS